VIIVYRARSLLTLAASALMLGACAGDGLGPAPLSAGGDQARTGEATIETSATAKASAFDPFREHVSIGGPREVIQNPSVAEIMKVGSLPEMAMGRPDAPVVIIKYMSLTCPYCRKFQLEDFPQLKRRYIDTGKVRFILREFPIGFQSGAATIALRCAPADKYFTLYEKFLSQQSQWVSQEVRTDPIFRIASQVGMTREQFDACRQNRGMIDGLQWVKERGRTLGIIGTPNFFIDGKLVKKVVSFQEIEAMIDPVLAGRPTAAAGGQGNAAARSQ
jgi:protein-disulfide isomerase